MNPIGGLWLAEIAWEAMHGLQWIGLLGDEDEAQLVFHVRQNAFGAAAPLALASLTLPGLVWRIAYGIGCSKRQQ